MRYFVNRLADFVPGSAVHVPKEAIAERTKALAQQIIRELPADFTNCDGGLYVGPAGVAYALYLLVHSGNFPSENQEYLARAQEYFAAHSTYLKKTRQRQSDQPGFLLGIGGVNVAGALISKITGDEKKTAEYLKSYSDAASICQPVHFLQCGSDELFVGRAGYLCGVLALNKALGVQVLSKETIHSLCNSIVSSGREYSRRHRSPAPLMYAYYKTEYLGAAHGLSAILQILLSFPEFFKSDATIERDIKDSVDYFLSIETPEGNYAPAVDETQSRRPAEHELVHWCHGAPGVVYMMAKAYLTWKEEKYLQACLRCGQLTWQKGLLRKGPGICHGIAGSGYVFLLLYRLTGDPKHLHRALQFAEFIYTEEFQKSSRRPDCPYSLYEGLAGTLCFLGDLLQPEKASFPFFEVF
ncbi:lanC-like protein 3 [Ptychodera flava]|uniref:lanC-like protein 3 n=1 Tax=Ptychodera flava TaxID=63121 RepID=UPI00396A1283